ncbi:MAG: manganese efflux pump [Veillonella sp.]|nr:manganese efflux pump [Veillonella sp.]MCF0156736.1 manganese efflux pump [Veillonella sp.]
MSILEICLIAVGLAMDAFGVAVYKGLVMKANEGFKKFMMPVLFGFFQFLMPVIGWLVGSQFASYIEQYDHWVIFVVLVWLGINTIRGANEEDEEEAESSTTWGEMLMLAVATSIDAMAVGIAFAFMSIDVVSASAWIGVITFFIALAGMYLGRFMGSFMEKRAEMIGGAVLILLGIKILLEGLGVL